MNWYISKLIFSIERDGATSGKAQFDEQLRLVTAKNTNEAYFKARGLGKKEESIFTDIKNETIKWRFVDVSEVSFLGELKDGIELYSNTLEVQEKKGFINSILQKGMSIQIKGLVLG